MERPIFMKITSSVKKQTVFLIIAAVILMVLIFLFSSQNGGQSSRLSIKVSRLIAKTVFFNYDSMDAEHQNFIVTELNFFVRKLAHFTVYTALGMVVYAAFVSFGSGFRYKWICAWGVCALYAVIDEIHQYFIPERSMRFRDVIIDSVGALFGIIIVSVIIIVYMHIKNSFTNKEK